MSVMQKLSEWYLEMDNDLNKLLEERDRLQAERDVAVKQAEQLQDDFAEAVENAARLQAQCEELRSDQKTLQEVWVAGRQRITKLQAELAATRKQLQDVCSTKSAGQNGLVRDVSHYTEAAEVDRPTEPQQHPAEYTPPEGWRLLQEGETLQKGDMWIRPSDGRRYPTKRVGSVADSGIFATRRYIRRIEQQPEQEFKPYTFAAYIVGDKSQPDALRIVWATEEWIQHANFGIVHRMSDLKFFGNDTFTPDQFSVNLKVQ